MGPPAAACRVVTPDSRVDMRAFPTHTGRPPGLARAKLPRLLPAAESTGRYGA
jgi:hypothetical protein